MSRPDGMSGLSYRMTMALSRDMFASNSWRCEAEAASGPTASARLLRLPVLAGFPVGGYSACREMLKRSEEHTSELQSLMRISYAVFCLKKKKTLLHNMKLQRERVHKQYTKHTHEHTHHQRISN